MNIDESIVIDFDGTPLCVWRPIRAPPLPPRGTSPPQQRPESCATSGDRSCAWSVNPPPRSRPLLPRGRNGVDGILKNAREAQSLLERLQSERLLEQKRHNQRRLKTDLDRQVLERHVTELLEYEQDLVHEFGPQMRGALVNSLHLDPTDPLDAFMAEEGRLARDTVPDLCICNRASHFGTNHASSASHEPVSQAQLDRVLQRAIDSCAKRRY